MVPDPAPVFLDAEQWTQIGEWVQVIGFGIALIVFLGAVIAVGTFRR